MIKDRSQAIMRSRWFMSAFCLALGMVVLAAPACGRPLRPGRRDDATGRAPGPGARRRGSDAHLLAGVDVAPLAFSCG
jgi:hypothetical protein